MASEAIEGKRNFGLELRAAGGDRPEQRRLLREMVMEVAGVNEDTARRVFDAFHDAAIVFITEEGWQESEDAKSSLRILGRMTDRLFPDEDTSSRT